MAEDFLMSFQLILTFSQYSMTSVWLVTPFQLHTFNILLSCHSFSKFFIPCLMSYLLILPQFIGDLLFIDRLCYDTIHERLSLQDSIIFLMCILNCIKSYRLKKNNNKLHTVSKTWISHVVCFNDPIYLMCNMEVDNPQLSFENLTVT